MCDQDPTADLAAGRIRRRLAAAGIAVAWSDVVEVPTGERHRAPQHGPFAWHAPIAATVVTVELADVERAAAHLAAAGFDVAADGAALTVALRPGIAVVADLDVRPVELVAAEAEERAAAPVLVVIGCGKDKRTEPAPAGDLYVGQHHRRARAAADALAARLPNARVMILSARHGLIELDDVIEPYDVTFTAGPRVRRGGPVVGTVGTDTIARQLRATGARAVVALAGREYAGRLADAAARIGADVVEPLAGTSGIGPQAARLRQIREGANLADAVLDAVAGPVAGQPAVSAPSSPTWSSCPPRPSSSSWPPRDVAAPPVAAAPRSPVRWTCSPPDRSRSGHDSRVSRRRSPRPRAERVKVAPHHTPPGQPPGPHQEDPP